MQYVDLPLLEVASDQSVSSATTDNFPFVQAQLTLAGVVQTNALNVVGLVVGTRVSAGLDATGKSVGAVFVFKYAPGPSRFTEVCVHRCWRWTWHADVAVLTWYPCMCERRRCKS